MSASSNQKISVSQCSFLCIWSIYYSLEQKVIFIYMHKLRTISFDWREQFHQILPKWHTPKEKHFSRAPEASPWEKTKRVRKHLLQITKTIPASFYQHKKCPLDIFTTQGFPCNLSNSIDCIQIHFQNFRTSKSQTTAKSRGLFLFLSKLNLLWHSLKV